MEERLQKILAHAGFGSRRACEDLITAHRVVVNGQVAIIGAKADPSTDKILVDGKPIRAPQSPLYIALHKPRGVVSTAADEFGRPTVIDLVDLETRLYPVGRLDLDSEGLVLLTNDGELANKLSHPKFEHPKEYRVLVARHPDEAQLDAFRYGVVMPDGQRTAPAEVRIEVNQGKGTWLNIILREGRKRQIRETCQQVGLPVVRILRTRIGTLLLGTLKPGEWRKLSDQEIAALKAPPAANRPRRTEPAPRPASRADRPPRTGRPASRTDRSPRSGHPAGPRRPSARITNEKNPRRPARPRTSGPRRPR